MIVNGQSEAENRSDDVDDVLANADLPTGSSAEVVGEEGIRVQAVEVGEGSELEDEREAKFLSMFVCTKSCRRKVWDAFFSYFHSPSPVPNNDVLPTPSEYAVLRQLRAPFI